MDCTQMSHEKMLYSSWMNKAVLAFLREDGGNGLVLDDSYPAVFFAAASGRPAVDLHLQKELILFQKFARKGARLQQLFPV